MYKWLLKTTNWRTVWKVLPLNTESFLGSTRQTSLQSFVVKDCLTCVVLHKHFKNSINTSGLYGWKEHFDTFRQQWLYLHCLLLGTKWELLTPVWEFCQLDLKMTETSGSYSQGCCVRKSSWVPHFSEAMLFSRRDYVMLFCVLCAVCCYQLTSKSILFSEFPFFFWKILFNLPVFSLVSKP